MYFIRCCLIAFLAILVTPMHAEGDPQGAREVFLAEVHALGSNKPIAEVAINKRRHINSRYAPDPTILAMVDRVADESGIPRSIMRFHVQKESDYNPRARNPKSTATGLLQLIKGSHEVIAGRMLTREEHFRLAVDPEYNLRLGAAHIKACMQVMPGATAEAMWRRCHVRGHRNVGGDIRVARSYFKPDSQGWLARGSVAVPWSTAYVSYRDIASKS